MLYIVGTPIGNLDDLSIRQAKTLLSCDIIAAEDTRSAKILLDACALRFNIHPRHIKIISYYKESEMEKLPEIMGYLNEEKEVALISESGMPLLSDPGYLLVNSCIREKIPMTVIPGPSSITAALIYSGFNPKKFMSLGFLPKKKGKIQQCIRMMTQIKNIDPETVFVFFESPLRMNDTLNCFIELKWNPDVVICREMTKKFEEIIRGKPAELSGKTFKGELTVIVS